MSARRRVAVGGLVHETCSRSARPTTLADFAVWRGPALASMAAGSAHDLGGMFAGLAAAGADAVPTMAALATPSGLIERAAFEVLADELMERLRDAAPLHGVLLALHGAGAGEGVDDLAGELASRVRRAVGGGVQVAATLDLHGHPTEAMRDALDLMIGCKAYPHTDLAARGEQAARWIAGARATRPACHIERLPLLTPPTPTSGGSVTAEVRARCLEVEGIPGVLDCTFFHGFPYTDSPHSGASVVVSADSAALARGVAQDVARFVWARRQRLLTPTLGAREAVEEALRAADSSDGRPVVVHETSDNPGGGAPGDGTHLLRALLELSPGPACFAAICDPTAAAAAHAAGVGGEVEVALGGHTDALHGPPLALRAVVTALTDGHFSQDGVLAGVPAALGPTACLRVDGAPGGAVEVVVTSARQQVFGPALFALHGVDVRQRRVVALKSSHHFRAGFEGLAAAIITADPPGLTTQRLESLPLPRRAGRPLWPLDREVLWEPAGVGG